MIAGLVADLLAVVFVVGVGAKLIDHGRTSDSIVAFGVPERAAGAMSWVLIASELAIASSLLLDRTRVVGAIGALVLLSLLTAGVAGNLMRGRAPECHCFGRLSRGRIGYSTVARNALLASMAAGVALSTREPAIFVGLVVAFGGAWLALGPMRPRPRSRAKELKFELTDEAGGRWTISRLLSEGRPVLLVFSQPTCSACQALLPALEQWQKRLVDRLTIAVVDQTTGGTPPVKQTSYRKLTDPNGDVAAAYRVTATPSAALIEGDGLTASEIARGATAISDLVHTSFAEDDLPRFPRRAAIARAARGAAALGAFPLVAAACGSSKSSSTSTTGSTASSSSRTKALKVGGAYICLQTYALCTNAPCVPSPHNPDIVICDCVVKDGYSVGLTPCAQKAPHGTTLYSTFSTALVSSTTRALTCPANVPWANCVDSICERDPHDSSKAHCQCPLVKTGPSFTFGGDCSAHTCGRTIWSGAHTTIGGNEVAAAMKRLGQPLTLPPPCPTS